MCINCNLINPILDSVCQDLGLEMGKYLAPSHNLSKYLFKKNRQILGNPDTEMSEWRKQHAKLTKSTNMFVHYANAGHFRYDVKFEKEIELPLVDLKLPLYTGKIVQIIPCPYYRYAETEVEDVGANVDTQNNTLLDVPDQRFHVLFNKEVVSQKEYLQLHEALQEALHEALHEALQQDILAGKFSDGFWANYNENEKVGLQDQSKQHNSTEKMKQEDERASFIFGNFFQYLWNIFG